MEIELNHRVLDFFIKFIYLKICTYLSYNICKNSQKECVKALYHSPLQFDLHCAFSPSYLQQFSNTY